MSLNDAFEDAVDRNNGLRLLGFRDGLPEAKIDVAAARRNTRTDGRQIAAQLLDRRERPTAVLTVCDILALGVVDALGQRGLTAGRDLSLVGFDDMLIAADAELTTVRQPVCDKGRLAALHLLEPETVPDQVSRYEAPTAPTSPG